jgi:hypothetical protein
MDKKTRSERAADLELDYESLNALAAALRRPVRSLIWQYDTDPFYAGSPARRAWAEWFAKIWQRFGFQDGVHLRRIHYVLVSAEHPILDINGNPYVNHVNCWSDLKSASRDARFLGLVPIDAFVDQRADDAVIYLASSERDAELSVEESLSASAPSLVQVGGWMPDPPEYEFTPTKVDQRFHIEIWAEKSTVSDVLLPLARLYGLNALMGAGDLSLTHCHQFVERAIASDRLVRILYVSDFDPAGRNMPITVARKIDFLIRQRKLDLDVQLRPVALTHDQCVENRLPRTPIKDSARGKGKFEERFGTGATELDALEALRPGLLRQILVDEIERYHDDDLEERVGEVADEFREELEGVHDQVLARHEHDLESLRAERRDLAKRCNAELAAIVARYDFAFRENAERYNAIQGTIASELHDEAPDPDGIDWPEPDDGDEDDDPLFDTSRDYVEQMDRFNEYQERPIERKIRSDAGTKKGPYGPHAKRRGLRKRK